MSIRHNLLEETYETIETIEENNFTELKKELGDILLHVVMHSIIAEEEKKFNLEEVIQLEIEKLIRRHPHIFGNVKVNNVLEVKQNWEKIKLQEGRNSILDGVPIELPALQKAFRIQDKTAKIGFQWENKDDAWKKVEEEISEFQNEVKTNDENKIEEEFGDILFALVNYGRYLNINPENALRKTNKKFISRFSFIESELKKIGKKVDESSLEEMDTLWNKAKKKLKSF